MYQPKENQGNTYYIDVYRSIVADRRYLQNLDWGAVRPGHPEGTIHAHIAELEQNLNALIDHLKSKNEWLTDVEFYKLLILIHVHDSFKADAKQNVSIDHPLSHASLASNFLREYCDDADLVAMVQYHDESFALFRQFNRKGTYDLDRWRRHIQAIRDWDTFLAFKIIDGCTAGKTGESLFWFFRMLAGQVTSKFGESDITAVISKQSSPVTMYTEGCNMHINADWRELWTPEEAEGFFQRLEAGMELIHNSFRSFKFSGEGLYIAETYVILVVNGNHAANKFWFYVYCAPFEKTVFAMTNIQVRLDTRNDALHNASVALGEIWKE